MLGLFACVYCRAQGGVAYPMVDTSAIVPIVPSVTLPATAIVILSGEMVIEVPIPCHRAAAVVGIVHGLCHGEVGGFHQFVCHVPIIRAAGDRSGQMVDTLPTAIRSLTLRHMPPRPSRW